MATQQPTTTWRTALAAMLLALAIRSMPAAALLALGLRMEAFQ